MLLTSELYEDLVDNIAVLFEKSFGKKIEKQYLEWRYLKNPNKDVLVAVDIENKQVLANYSASPCLLCIKGKSYKTGLSMTTMTHPNFRRRGLFPKLAKELYNHMISLNYVMIWGFPNANSHETFNQHLGWNDIYSIPMMQLSVIDTKKNGDVPRFDNDFNLNYTESKGLESLIHVKKDKQYLRWRYGNNPINKYNNFVVCHGNEVSSFCVTKLYEGNIDLVDFQADNIEEGEYLFRQVMSFAYTHGCSFLNCWAPRHHFIYSLCEKFNSRKTKQITSFGFHLLHNKDYQAYIQRYENWYIQMGDSDVY